MTPINNSDTAWLIVSDYNQDNNLPYEELREDLANPNVCQWLREGYGLQPVETIIDMDDGDTVGSGAFLSGGVGGAGEENVGGNYWGASIGGIRSKVGGDHDY
jgi:hypothetical protein